jgi:hypothetical protein
MKCGSRCSNTRARWLRKTYRCDLGGAKPLAFGQHNDDVSANYSPMHYCTHEACLDSLGVFTTDERVQHMIHEHGIASGSEEEEEEEEEGAPPIGSIISAGCLLKIAVLVLVRAKRSGSSVMAAPCKRRIKEMYGTGRRLRHLHRGGGLLQQWKAEFGEGECLRPMPLKPCLLYPLGRATSILPSNMRTTFAALALPNGSQCTSISDGPGTLSPGQAQIQEKQRDVHAQPDLSNP